MKLFRKDKFIHVPISVVGYVIWLLAVIFLAIMSMGIVNDSQSVGETIFGISLFLIPAIILVELFASKTSN